jgi:hypothetical protein
MTNAKKQFAARLKKAMETAGYAAKPAVLEREFNLRYLGSPLTLHAASGRQDPSTRYLVEYECGGVTYRARRERDDSEVSQGFECASART